MKLSLIKFGIICLLKNKLTQNQVKFFVVSQDLPPSRIVVVNLALVVLEIIAVAVVQGNPNIKVLGPGYHMPEQRFILAFVSQREIGVVEKEAVVAEK